MPYTEALLSAVAFADTSVKPNIKAHRLEVIFRHDRNPTSRVSPFQTRCQLKQRELGLYTQSAAGVRAHDSGSRTAISPSVPAERNSLGMREPVSQDV